MQVYLSYENLIPVWTQIRAFVHGNHLINEVLNKNGEWVDHPYFSATGLIHAEDVIYRPGETAFIEIAGNIAFSTESHEGQNTGPLVEIDDDQLTIRFHRQGEQCGVRILRVKP